MADTVEDAKREAREDAGDGIARLANRMGAAASAEAVFGTAVEREGVTVIPVARVRWGFGGGSGKEGKKGDGDGDGSGEGWGGGGGVQCTPLGYIELKDGAAEYRRISDPMRAAPAILLLPLSFAASAAVVALTFGLLARSLRGTVRLPRLSDLPVPHVPRPHLAHPELTKVWPPKVRRS
jgi:uncharacterized spore protein YtfJ